ncbi:MAG: VOC family protein [Novosphingobium sp.]
MARHLLLLAAIQAALPYAALAEPAPVPRAAPAPGLLGAAINVADVQKEVDFYTKGLGWRVATTLDLGSRSETILMYGDNPAGASILLMHDKNPDASAIIAHGNGFSRLVIRVSDLAEIADRLDAQGYPHEQIRSAAMGVRIMLLNDPEGFKIELVEQPAKGTP